MVRKRRLLAGDLHVRLDNHKRSFLWKFFQDMVSSCERIIRWQWKINSSKHGGHKHVTRPTRRRRDANPALAWRAIRQIRRSAHGNRWVLQGRSDFGITVDMVAQRHCVGARVAQGLQQIRGNSRAIANIFAVDDHHVNRMFFPQCR